MSLYEDIKNIKNEELKKKLPGAIKAAIEVLVHNFKLNEPDELPMGSGWGYHEPYTRDLLISLLGILILSKEDYEDEPDNYDKMIKKILKVLETLAENQTERGHIPSLVNSKEEFGASDTTPLFVLAVGLFQAIPGKNVVGGNKDQEKKLNEAVQKAKTWMEYQSPDDSGLVAQLEANDWRDEMWGFQGFCLFINTLVYSYLRLSKHKVDHERAEKIKEQMNQHVPYGLLTTHENFFAMCVSKRCIKNPNDISDFNKWFDLMGNSLAILSGIASPKKAGNIISWVDENYVEAMKPKGIIARIKWLWAKLKKRKKLGLPPNFLPFVQERDMEWCERYKEHCLPGNYLNGGIWPFVCGFYIAALVANGKMALAEKKTGESAKWYEMAEQKLDALTDLVKLKRETSLTEERERLNAIPFG
ncbi:MAG TPA: hypothetical protein VK186_13900, partial [Candidatus Deferrimicrobium sp.]|nr:hypothetical protein [Candidatus Deferrimicrobium sp.]